MAAAAGHTDDATALALSSTSITNRSPSLSSTPRFVHLSPSSPTRPPPCPRGRLPLSARAPRMSASAVTRTLPTLTLAGAKVASDAAEAKARELGIAINIAVADHTTHLLYFVRMDNAKITSMDIAIDKVRHRPHPPPLALHFTVSVATSLPHASLPISVSSPSLLSSPGCVGLHVCGSPQRHVLLSADQQGGGSGVRSALHQWWSLQHHARWTAHLRRCGRLHWGHRSQRGQPDAGRRMRPGGRRRAQQGHQRPTERVGEAEHSDAVYSHCRRPYSRPQLPQHTTNTTQPLLTVPAGDESCLRCQMSTMPAMPQSPPPFRCHSSQARPVAITLCS